MKQKWADEGEEKKKTRRTIFCEMTTNKRLSILNCIFRSFDIVSPIYCSAMNFFFLLLFFFFHLLWPLLTLFENTSYGILPLTHFSFPLNKIHFSNRKYNRFETIKIFFVLLSRPFTWLLVQFCQKPKKLIRNLLETIFAQQLSLFDLAISLPLPHFHEIRKIIECKRKERKEEKKPDGMEWNERQWSNEVSFMFTFLNISNVCTLWVIEWCVCVYV